MLLGKTFFNPPSKIELKLSVIILSKSLLVLQANKNDWY